MAFEILKPEWGALRPIRGILFDMDGLVLDTEKLYSRFWREACAFYGYTMSYEQSLQMRGLGGPAGEAMLHSFFGPEVHYMTIRAKRIALMDAYLREVGPEPKPGIHELLDYLAEHRIPCAITSSSPPERIREYLARLDLYHRFTKICSGHQVPNGKPAPDIYLYGVASLELSAEHCLALEDAPAGILSASRAGTLPVIIPDQDQPSEETLAMCCARADSLLDIIDILAENAVIPSE